MDTAGLVMILVGIYLLDSAVKNRRPLETLRRIVADPGSIREAIENPETFGEYSSPSLQDATPGSSGESGFEGGGGIGSGGGGGWSMGTSVDSSSTPADSSSRSQKAAVAIAFAKRQIGKPYVWGGDGYDNKRGGFDCSGLVMNAWKAAGVNIPRTTATMLPSSKLQKIKKSELVAGDLVFPFPGHVQLYIGNGRIIEAPGRKRNIREKTLGDVWQARRVKL